MADSSPSPSRSPSRDANQLPIHLLPNAISKTNAHIIHLTRLLSSSARLDALLALLTYTAKFLSTTTALAPTTTHPLHRLRPSLLALSALLSDLRSSLRLFGLLGIYTWGLSIWRDPPADYVLRGIAWAQVVANTAFQALENVAVLVEKGVLKSKRWEGVQGRERRKRLWLWSSRAWMAHVALEGGRLVRVWWVGAKRKGKEVDGEGRIVKKEEEVSHEVTTVEVEKENEKVMKAEKWWRDVLVNAAYAPMTMHGSVENGLLAEPWLGALGLVAAGVGFRQAWRETL